MPMRRISFSVMRSSADRTRAARRELAATLEKLRGMIAKQATAATDPKLPSHGPKEATAEATKRTLPMKVYKLNADLPSEDFVKVISDLVEPASWNDDTYIHGVPGAIVVKQTPAIQKRVEQMLITLGAIPDPRKSATSIRPIAARAKGI